MKINERGNKCGHGIHRTCLRCGQQCETMRRPALWSGAGRHGNECSLRPMRRCSCPIDNRSRCEVGCPTKISERNGLCDQCHQDLVDIGQDVIMANLDLSKKPATKRMGQTRGGQMRVSDISNWSACESNTRFTPRRVRWAAPTSPLTWVSLAHAMVADEPLPEPSGANVRLPTMPPRRRSGRRKSRQRQSPGLPASCWLTGVGAYWQKQELRSDAMTGHLDMRAWHSDHGEAIIDLKTGQIGTAWLQVGGYLNAIVAVSGPSNP